MTRFFAVTMLVLLAVGCERDYKAGTGYGPGVGYSSSGMTYAAGGGTLPLEDVGDGGSTVKEDTTKEDNAEQDTQGADQVCTGSTTYCDCMNGLFPYTDYCDCLDTEETEHSDQPYWCQCKFLLCVDPPKYEDPQVKDICASYFETCI